MSYQNVGTPRFYMNDIFYAQAVGIDVVDMENDDLYVGGVPYYYDVSEEEYYKIISGNPTNPIEFLPIKDDIPRRIIRLRYRIINRHIDRPANYFAVLNHNLYSSKIAVRSGYRKDETKDWNGANQLYDIVNSNHGHMNFAGGNASNFGQPLADGFSIFGMNQNGEGGSADGNNEILDFTFSPNNEDWGDGSNDNSPSGFTTNFQVGSIFYGRYYEMPYSAELKVNMTIENDGFKLIETAGGSTFQNLNYDGVPTWKQMDGSEIPAWTIGRPTTSGRRRGRRIWKLEFTDLQAKYVFPANYIQSSRYSEDDTQNTLDYNDNGDYSTDEDSFKYTFEDDDSFVAQVLNKAGLGHRFIFQPDSSNSNPDQFAICQIDTDRIGIRQVANGIYKFSLTIREVW